jgi:hypothetical protein
MEIRPIRTDKDHKAALAEIEACGVHPRDPNKAINLTYFSHLLRSTKRKDGLLTSPNALIRSMCSTMPSRNLGTARWDLPSY